MRDPVGLLCLLATPYAEQPFVMDRAVQVVAEAEGRFFKDVRLEAGAQKQPFLEPFYRDEQQL